MRLSLEQVIRRVKRDREKRMDSLAKKLLRKNLTRERMLKLLAEEFQRWLDEDFIYGPIKM